MVTQSPMFQCPLCRQVANLTASVSMDSLVDKDAELEFDQGEETSSQELNFEKLGIESLNGSGNSARPAPNTDAIRGISYSYSNDLEPGAGPSSGIQISPVSETEGDEADKWARPAKSANKTTPAKRSSFTMKIQSLLGRASSPTHPTPDSNTRRTQSQNITPNAAIISPRLVPRSESPQWRRPLTEEEAIDRSLNAGDLEHSVLE